MMGIFTRVRDVVSSNVNAMLDKAEDPEKLVKMMIREMEDTLVGLKRACAEAMAARKRAERQKAALAGKAEQWTDRAKLAVDKGRDELAREALMERRKYRDQIKAVEVELGQYVELVDQYQADIIQIEEKLATARERQRILMQRYERAEKARQVEQHLRRYDTSDAMARFEAFDERLSRVDDGTWPARKSSLEQEFEDLLIEDEIDQELEGLKKQSPSAP